MNAPPVMEVTGGLNWILNMLWSPLSAEEQSRRAKDPYPITADIRLISGTDWQNDKSQEL